MTAIVMAEHLRGLPALARTAAQRSIEATYGGSDGSGIRTAPGSKEPPGVNLDRAVLERDRQWPRLLARLGQCVRVVREECPIVWTTGPEAASEGSETWVGECSWLIATLPDWYPDDWTREYVATEVHDIRRKLGAKAERPDADGLRRCSICGTELVAYSTATLDVAECLQCERVIGMRERPDRTARLTLHGAQQLLAAILDRLDK